MVSSMAMLIQPISARTSGRARWRVGRSSERGVGQESMGNRRVYGKEVEEGNEVKEVKEVKERKLLVGGDRGEVPLTVGRGVDTVDCRTLCVAWNDVEIARWVAVG